MSYRAGEKMIKFLFYFVVAAVVAGGYFFLDNGWWPQFSGFLDSFWEIAEPLIGIGTIVLAAKIWLQVRVKRAKKLEIGEDAILVNWTGHPFTADWAVEKGIKVWNQDNAYVPKFDTTSTDALIESIDRLITDLPDEIEARLCAGSTRQESVSELQLNK